MTKPKPETEASLSAVRVKRLSDLTPDEKRIIVAEFDCGCLSADKKSYYVENYCWQPLPDYPNDQNAIIAACGKFDMGQQDLFAINLYHLVIPSEQQYSDHFISWKIAKTLINATASQRTNALILTIGAATL
jgi:hypothetical protein